MRPLAQDQLIGCFFSPTDWRDDMLVTPKAHFGFSAGVNALILLSFLFSAYLFFLMRQVSIVLDIAKDKMFEDYSCCCKFILSNLISWLLFGLSFLSWLTLDYVKFSDLVLEGKPEGPKHVLGGNRTGEPRGIYSLQMYGDFFLCAMMFLSVPFVLGPLTTRYLLPNVQTTEALQDDARSAVASCGMRGRCSTVAGLFAVDVLNIGALMLLGFGLFGAVIKSFSLLMQVVNMDVVIKSFELLPESFANFTSMMGFNLFLAIELGFILFELCRAAVGYSSTSQVDRTASAARSAGLELISTNPTHVPRSVV